MTGRFARQQIKERNRRLVRKHWWRLALMGFVILAFGAATWLVTPDLQVPVWGALPAICFAVLAGYWDQLAGTTSLSNGRDAEAWTSKELRKVCGPGWHVVDGISFAFHDVDHVLVGPGGVYAVETKYSDSTIDLSSRRGQECAARWAEQALEGARSIRLLLWDLDVDHVYPGVVAWGSEISGNPRFINGVPILRPGDLQEVWMPWRRDQQVLNESQVNAIVSELVAHRDKRLAYERGHARHRAA